MPGALPSRPVLPRAQLARPGLPANDRGTRLRIWALPVWLALTASTHVQAQPTTGAFASLRVGAGLTQRLVDVPNEEGPRRLDLGPTPAVVLGIDAGLPYDAWRLGSSLSYRTSLRGRVADVRAGPGASATRTAVRSHELEAGLRAGRAWGHAHNRFMLALFAGYNVRAFSSVAVLRVPRFTLHGPVARVELDLPLTVGHIRLRLAPEVQWLASISRALADVAGLPQRGLALGAQLRLSVALSQRWGAALDYRESHALARSRSSQLLSDVARYLLLEITLRVD